MKKTLLATTLFAAPLLAFGQSLLSLRTLVQSLGDIVNMLIPIMIAVALVFFFWGLIQYIRHPEKETGKQTMIIGIVALFIMVSIWGIVLFAQNALGIQSVQSLPTPRVQY